MSESVVDDKATRILRLIFRTAMNTYKPFGNMDYAAHSAVGRRIGGEGIVLLQNNAPKKGQQVLLPIEANQYNKILVVGDNATRRFSKGGGSSELKVQHETSILSAMQAKYSDKLTYVEGYEPCRDANEAAEEKAKQLRAEAVEAAKQAAVIVFVGGLNNDQYQDNEGGDRKTYDLPFWQNELLDEMLTVNPNVVTVIVSGNAVRIPYPSVCPPSCRAGISAQR